MRASLLPVLLTVSGGVLYHVSQKSMPRTAHPLVAILVAYLVASAACLLALRWIPSDRPLGAALRQLDWAVVGLGLAVAAIEIGFLLSYRAGWPLNVASLIVNLSVALLLIPVGLAAFGEGLTVARAAGVVLSLVGLALIVRG